MSALTVAMIVRNEEQVLPRFLEHLKPLGAQLLVVDTGSTDGTVALLEAAGATVLHRPWDHDFSAARNHGLAQIAAGRWVLVLDADELVSPALVDDVRTVLTDPSVGAATLVMRNTLSQGHRRDARLLRLFRADPSVRYQHRIHEDASEPIAAALIESGQRLVHLQGHVDHLGYQREVAQARGKKERDLRLLRSCIEADPRDLYSRFKLLELARFWDDVGLWRASAREAAAVLETVSAEALREFRHGGEFIALVAQGVLGDQPKEAAQWMGRFLPWLIPSPAFHLMRGEHHERAGEAVEAEADFQKALTLEPPWGQDLQLNTVRPRMGLARLRWAQGALAAAREEIDAALAANPRDVEALIAGVALVRQMHGTRGVFVWVQAQRQRLAGAHELDWALGEEAMLRGDPKGAVEALRKAERLGKSTALRLRLSQALLGSGRLDEARLCAAALTPDRAEAGLGVLLCDLIRCEPTELELPLEQDVADRALREWLGIVAMAGRKQWNLALRRQAPAVAHLFPWFQRHVEALDGARAH